jgi:diaminohydroxyphosphoribosylaminopyrimidine deaminase/5-amino-6-(5-phosphoribosylamino)uracil reductase
MIAAATNPHPPGSAEHYMYVALQLAQHGLGWTSPNPLVGCVLVRDGAVIGRGFHARDGGPHAEVRALRDAGDARGAAAYVTLEPCTHVGRQPACAMELARAGVSRVYWGSDDADPRTAGAAGQVLSAQGIEASGGVLRRECREFIDYYLHGHRHREPFFHVKLAASLDGKIACHNGRSQWLSGPASLGYAHYLRWKYDAVLVSAGTVRADDPQLTVRPGVLKAYLPQPTGSELRNPVRVVLDPDFTLLAELSRYRLADLEGVFRPELPRLIIAGRRDALPAGQQPPAGADVLGIPAAASGRLDFHALKAALWQIGIRSVLVEGGGRLVAELTAQRALDKLSIVHAPVLIGGDGRGFTGAWGHGEIDACPQLAPCRAWSLGPDTLTEGYPLFPEPATDG